MSFRLLRRASVVFKTSCASGRLHASCRHFSGRSDVFKVAEEVEDAVRTGKPVVALETTIYTHGFPYPENVALASHLESVVRVNGGIPATVGVLNGIARVGMGTEELIELTASAGKETTKKVSRRDLAWMSGLGLSGTKLNGGTTISGTMVLAHLAGIKVFATGGLGGVHRGGEISMDISADLTELGRTPVAVISSGSKSFLDIPRTLEYLETQGVGVATLADGRQGSVDFPAFYSRESGIKSPKVIRDEVEAAAIIYANSRYPLSSGLLLANPVPTEFSIPKEDMDSIIAEAVRLAEEQGFHGSDNTPFILSKIKELSGGRSIPANRALIEANVKRGTIVARELAKLELAERPILERFMPAFASPHQPQTDQPESEPPSRREVDSTTVSTQRVDVVVAGSVAIDLNCDFTPLTTSAPISPILHTSNPSAITQSLGGVGRNVAVAAKYAGASVAMCSLVGDDLSGKTARSALQECGISTAGIQVLADGYRTAQFVAINDQKKDLVMGMADMSIMESHQVDFATTWEPYLNAVKPAWLVVDGNWSSRLIQQWTAAAKKIGARVAFEPVSTAKAARIFTGEKASVVPHHATHLATPNKLELQSMFRAAQQAELFETPEWWDIINSLGISSSGARDKLSMITTPHLVDEGIPQQTVQLLPFIPTIVTKLGSQGLLLSQLLRQGDHRLTSPDHAPYILSRGDVGESEIGGVYLRLFPAAEVVSEAEVVSVNGVGDTLLGVTVAALVNSPDAIEDALAKGQKASVMTLKDSESVSRNIQQLQVV